MRYAISGAGRGLGLEFVRQLLNRGDSIDAGVRAPAEASQLQRLVPRAEGRLRVYALDVASPDSVMSFAAALKEGAPVDVLINNAGVHGERMGPVTGLDYDDMLNTFSVNTLGSLRLSAALLPALRRGSVRRMVHISSSMGSVGDNTMGGSYGYRLSKAALNMAMRNLHVDLHGEGFVTIALNPGWCKTDMGGAEAPLHPEESVRGMLNVIDKLSARESGRFLSYDGSELPW